MELYFDRHKNVCMAEPDRGRTSYDGHQIEGL